MSFLNDEIDDDNWFDSFPVKGNQQNQNDDEEDYDNIGFHQDFNDEPNDEPCCYAD